MKERLKEAAWAAWETLENIWEGLKEGIKPVMVFVAVAVVSWAVGYVVIEILTLVDNLNNALEKGC